MRRCIALIAMTLTLQGCAPTVNSPEEFRLPEGNFVAGRKAFVDLKCYVCHQINGLDVKFEGTPVAAVALGGNVTRVKTYAELVTSIINPSHKIVPGYLATDVAPNGESIMTLAGLNDVVTVTQLVDLVAFLQPQYKVVTPAYNPYTYRYTTLPIH